jgi:thioredoxin reductase (NADPH)
LTVDYEIYDVMIIGAGPAGMSAGVNARVRAKSVALVSRRFASPSLAKAPSVHNYLGVEEMSGTELYSRFLEHARRAEARLVEADVTGIYDMGGHFSALTSAGDISARAVIIATGAVQSASIPGESELLGAGVSYCATCDGPLYRGKRVVVLGYTAEAREEANFLAEICSEVTYVDLQRGKADKGTPLANSVREVVGKVVGIRGESFVTHVELVSEEIPVDGVFVIRESIPAERLLDGLVVTDGAIAVDREMATSVSGVFAAGDCTGRPWQVAKAVGEGLVAGLSAARYVDRALAAARAEGR